ncbi:hypothetical protein A9Z42_0031090 [Trichoderma parareesei]|uniref:Uncharacterized protein n=1 Tax=Trichoderma parareesei TaxID=858221 RepID=A0A2H2YZP3_TRIPA|nr:hypothetical protein A9Z42_0031090 [Trichoderma parareesei]
MSLGYSRMLQQIGAAVAVQLSAVAFNTRLAKNLGGLPLTPDEMSSLQAGSQIGGDLSTETKDAILVAYCKAIQRGVADPKEANNSDSGSESLTLSVLGPSEEVISSRNHYPSAHGREMV